MQKLNLQAQVELRKNRSSWAIDVSFYLLGFLGLSYTVIFTVLLAHLPLKVWSLALFFVLYSAIIMYYVISKYPHVWEAKWRSALIALIAVVISFALSGLVYDTSYDGQGYHQMTINSLQHGWNPIYSPPYSLSLWVWRYPKALWMIGANFYSLTGLIETAKAVNLISFFASFFALLAVLGRLFAERLSFIASSAKRPGLCYGIAAVVAVCAACNPVTIVQLFTFYNDGIIGSLLLTLISALLYNALYGDKRPLVTAAICLIILVNIKFTALAYAGLICVFFLIYLLLRHRHSFKRTFLFLACTGFIGIVLFGYNPYVVNTISKGNPFYPLAGKDKVDIITENSPANFIGASKLKAFLLSNTATTYNPITPEVSRPTDLWPVKWDDFHNLDVDSRTGGFGPLTYWILISSLALWSLTLLFKWKAGIAAGIITAGLMFTAFINPAPWWARYVPQVWLIPLALVAMGLMTKSTIIRTVSFLVLIITLISAEETVRVVLGHKFKQSSEVQAQYEQLVNKHIQVFTNATASVLPHLQTHHINYTEVKQEGLSCKNPTPFLYALGAEYCEVE